MKGLRYWWLMGCLGAALFGAPSAQAAGGQISFSGAVVEPTCALNTAELTLATSDYAHACASANHGAATQGGSRLYDLTVRPLDSGPIGDRLLAYFDGYMSAAGQGDRLSLVTQTYE